MDQLENNSEERRGKRRGRPPKGGKRREPSILKIQNGVSDKYIKKDEPVPDVLSDKIQAPKHLTPNQKKHWKKTVGDLLHMKLMATVDMNLVEEYSIMLDAWDECQRLAAQHGWFELKYAEDDPTRLVKSVEQPWFKKVSDMSLKLLKFAQEFGFSPCSRSYLSTEANKNHNVEDSIESFIEATGS